ncbi:MAG: DciA family protein [Planctomycetota bacterium]|jgi:hypothetical protein
MGEEEELRRIIERKPTAPPHEASKLGDVVREIMNYRILPRQKRFASVAQIWVRLLPEQLQRNCKLIDISAGQLKVQVQSKAYEQELRWCSTELLRQLQEQCPQAKIKKIKFVVG